MTELEIAMERPEYGWGPHLYRHLYLGPLVKPSGLSEAPFAQSNGDSISLWESRRCM
jgi:hypothetical protein